MTDNIMRQQILEVESLGDDPDAGHDCGEHSGAQGQPTLDVKPGAGGAV